MFMQVFLIHKKHVWKCLGTNEFHNAFSPISLKLWNSQVEWLVGCLLIFVEQHFQECDVEEFCFPHTKLKSCSTLSHTSSLHTNVLTTLKCLHIISMF